jgi:hypothetical protein
MLRRYSRLFPENVIWVYLKRCILRGVDDRLPFFEEIHLILFLKNLVEAFIGTINRGL